jgi:cytidyltransferase-like protein
MMKRIYCDGIFDLFHTGHLKHFEKIAKLFDEPIVLIVGVISDNVATNYKRKPVLSQYNRFQIVKSCKYVNEVFITDVLIMDEDFLLNHNIDFVVHGFTSDDREKQREFFKIPIELGKFKELDYHQGVSTTQLIKKTNRECKKRRTGFADYIRNYLHIKKSDTICEFGYIDDELTRCTQNCYYIDIDCPTNKDGPFIFIDNMENMFRYHFFNFTIVNNFEKYNDHELLLKELDRITKSGIYISNIQNIEKDFFIKKGYSIITKTIFSTSNYDAFICYNNNDYF